jgi:threonine/homoserine/homoserine lactone efflux protein
MDQSFLLGALVSLSVAMPIGPIAMICIRRTLHDGLGIGVASGIGAATVHFCYGSLALSGSGAAVEFLRLHQASAQAAGGIIVILLAGRMLSRSGAIAPAASSSTCRAMLTAYTNTCLVAFSNPMTVLGLAANLSAFGLFGAGHHWQISAGMFCGSTMWWILLCSTGAALHCRLEPSTVLRINRCGCIGMTLFGATSIIRALW